MKSSTVTAQVMIKTVAACLCLTLSHYSYVIFIKRLFISKRIVSTSMIAHNRLCSHSYLRVLFTLWCNSSPCPRVVYVVPPPPFLLFSSISFISPYLTPCSLSLSGSTIEILLCFETPMPPSPSLCCHVLKPLNSFFLSNSILWLSDSLSWWRSSVKVILNFVLAGRAGVDW